MIFSPASSFICSVQWGLPTVSVPGVVGMLAGVLASAIESVGVGELGVDVEMRN